MINLKKTLPLLAAAAVAYFYWNPKSGNGGIKDPEHNGETGSENSNTGSGISNAQKRSTLLQWVNDTPFSNSQKDKLTDVIYNKMTTEELAAYYIYVVDYRIPDSVFDPTDSNFYNYVQSIRRKYYILF